MPSHLVETYLARPGGEDDICFFLFKARSGRDAALVAPRPDLESIRVVEAASSEQEEK
jgi:hypothetical protein